MEIGVIIELLHKPFFEALETIYRLGVVGIQVDGVNGILDGNTCDNETVSRIKTALKKKGMRISAVCGDLGGHGFLIPSGNRYKIEKTKKIIDMANRFDCRIVTTHIGVIPDDEHSNGYKVMSEAMSELAEYAAARSSYLAIETGPEKVMTLKRFIKNVNSKGLAVNYDPANLYMVTHEDAAAGVYELRDYIVHTHAKDGIRGEKFNPKAVYDHFAEGGIEDLNLQDYFTEMPLGAGGVNFDTYIAALKNIGYNGFLTIERETAKDPIGDIEKAVSFLKPFTI